jgi:hypothetical protein
LNIIKVLELAATGYGVVLCSGVTVSKTGFETGNPLANGQWTNTTIDPVFLKSAAKAKSFDPMAAGVRDLHVV